MTCFVYVAGPISKGDYVENVRQALLAAATLRARGFVCYVPHRSLVDQLVAPETYENWMADDFAWIERCDALVRLPGESPGSDREVAHARKLGISVYLGLGRFLAEVPAPVLGPPTRRSA